MSPFDHQAFALPELITEHLRGSMGIPAIARQFRYAPEEALGTEEDLSDPTGDAAHSPVKGIVHRYKDRVLLLPVMSCAAHCRFCFRRERLGGALTPEELETALDYIRGDEGIWEVILSGGDPLLLSKGRLDALLDALDQIPHVATVRIHTRLPVMDPARVPTLPKTEKALWLVLHVNHAEELTAPTLDSLRRLDVPLLSQTVLLKGVNDNLETLAALFKKLVRNRIKPYYLHHCDPAPGTSHFRVPVEEGKALVKALWRAVPGPCRPTYVLDNPDGRGKIPLSP